jgi:hypothetical protein
MKRLRFVPELKSAMVVRLVPVPRWATHPRSGGILALGRRPISVRMPRSPTMS